MPSYDYKCPECNGYLIETHPIGTAPRGRGCPRCGGAMELCIGVGVSIAPSALEHKGREVRQTVEMEKQWDVDRPAYKRLRNKGMQPESVDGAAELENRVTDQFDVKYGHLYGQASKEQIREGIEQAALIEAGAM